MTKEKAIKLAVKEEKRTGKPHYVIYNRGIEAYEVVAYMPMLGEWYTSDGLRHG